MNSLSVPGNSYTHVNPVSGLNEPIVAGDLIQGKPGVSNGKNVRDTLSNLENYAISVPVWDISVGQGNNSLYHIVGFADVQIIGFNLPGQNRISVILIGFSSCGAPG